MSSSKAKSHSVAAASTDSPPNMVTPIASLKDIGVLLAAKHALAPGFYDLVLEYRFGGGSINLESGVTEPAMAITLNGVGLRHVEKAGPMSIEVTAPVAKARKGKSQGEVD